MTSLTFSEIIAAAETTSTVLKELGYSSCIVGSAACALWGMKHRTPHDVDIVILDSSVDLEFVKQTIVSRDSGYYLVNSKDPRATYKVLWYHIPDTPSYFPRRCKIDILKPGELGIPSVPVDELYGAGGTPKKYENLRIMPFVPLFLLKVQAWEHHKTSMKLHFRGKVPQDVVDIRELLRIADRQGFSLKDGENWLPAWFMDEGRRRVERFWRDHGSGSTLAVLEKA